MPLQIQTARIALLERRETEENAFDKTLRATIQCLLPEARAHEMTAAPAWLCLQIHAVNLVTQVVELLISQARVLQPEQSEAAHVLEFAAPAAGRYQLQIVAFLSGPAPQIVFQSGPLLRVEPEEFEEAASVAENFDAGMDSESDLFATEPESSVQGLEMRRDTVFAVEHARAEESFSSEEVSTPPAHEAQTLVLATTADEPIEASLMLHDPQFRQAQTPASVALRSRYFRLSDVLEIPLGLLSLIGLLALGFGFPHQPELVDRQRSLLELERTLLRLQAIALRDSARVSDLKKIFVIMERYAPAMGVELKFEIAATIYEMTLKYSNLDLELICATITHETGRTWNPQSISPVGARGLMQIMPLTGEMLARAEGISWSTAQEVLFDPVLNVRLGCRYLSTLVNTYNVDGGLAAYNGGEKRAEMWLRQGRAAGILAQETSFYVPSILKLYAEFRRLRG